MIVASMVCVSLAYPGYDQYHGYGGHHEVAHHGGGYEHGGYAAQDAGESDYGHHHQQVARIGESHGHEYADQHHHEEEEHVDYYVSLDIFMTRC